MQTLRDIVIPDAVAYTPQTAAWAVVLVVFLGIVGWSVLAWVRHARRNHYRTLALAKLAEIEQREAFSELPVLVKQTMLSICPRGDVASLSGYEWLRFLDETYPGDAFTRGVGRQLPELAYGRVDAVDVDELVSLVRQWITKHHVGV